MFFRGKKDKSKRKTTEEQSSVRGRAGKRLYAIGDVHGCLDELKELMSLIKADNAKRPAKDCIIVFLGDLIDRGPDSCGVIEYVMTEKIDFAQTYCLTGNHEEMFLRILKGESDIIPEWLKYGGDTCLESYGIDLTFLEGKSNETMELTIRKYVPESHIKFLDECLETIIFGDYLLVHAGIDPMKNIESQDRRKMRWIREPFLSYEGTLEKKIVHGHTIEGGVVNRPHRIGVDTGAYETGILSAVRLEDDTVSVLST